jgi:hypothetical protein
MNGEQENVWKEAVRFKHLIGNHVEETGVVLIWHTIPAHYLERLKNTTKNLSQDIRSPSLDVDPGPLEHEAGILTISFVTGNYFPRICLEKPRKSTEIPVTMITSNSVQIRALFLLNCLEQESATYGMSTTIQVDPSVRKLSTCIHLLVLF